jgi:hypothetical protein
MTCAMDGQSYGPCLGQVTPVIEECATSADEDCDGVDNDHCGVWARRFGAGGDQGAEALAVDASGNVIVAGNIAGTVDFGGGSITSAGLKDAFVLKLDKSGNHLWSKVIGDATEQDSLGVAVDSAGNIVVTGYFQGTVSFNGGMPPVHTAQALEDIFVVKYDAGGNYLWSVAFPGDGSDRGIGAAFDASGDVYVTGSFGGLTSFGVGAPAVPFNLLDGFLVKISSAGVPLWVKTFGEMDDDQGIAVTTSPAGHVFVTGNFSEVVDFGGGEIKDDGGTDVFLAELTGDGSYIFAGGYGGTSDQFVHSISRDAAGNIVLAGDFYASANFGGGLITAGGMEDMWVTKLDSAGSHVWTRAFGDAAAQEHTVAAFDPAGDVIFAVSMYGTVDFGAGDFTANGAGGSDVVIGKLKGSTGNYQWARKFGDGSDQDARGIATDSTGSVFVAGEFSGVMDLGLTPDLHLDNVSLDDIWVAKLSP